MRSTKTFLLAFISSIISGYFSYYIIRGCLNVALWLFDYELTVLQRNFVIENGYLAFVAGMMIGLVVFWRVFKKVLSH